MEKGGQFCVAKEDTGQILQCYPKRDDALAYMRALYANSPDAGGSAPPPSTRPSARRP